MSPDIRDALQQAAARPRDQVDPERLVARGRQMTRHRLAAAGTALSLLTVAVGATAVLTRDDGSRRIGLTNGEYYPGTPTQLAQSGVLHLPPPGAAEPALLGDGERVFLLHRADRSVAVVGAARTGDWLAVAVGACPDASGFRDPVTGTTWDSEGRYVAGTELADLAVFETLDAGAGRIRVPGMTRRNSGASTGAPTCADPVFADAPAVAAPDGVYGETATDGWARYDGLIASVSGRWHLCGTRDSQPTAATARLTGCPGGLPLPEHEAMPADVDALRGTFVGFGAGGRITRLLLQPDVAPVPKPTTELFGYVTEFKDTADGFAVVVDKADWYVGADAIREGEADGVLVGHLPMIDGKPVHVRNVNALLRTFTFRPGADVWLTSTSRLFRAGETDRRLTPTEFRDRWQQVGEPRTTLGFWFAVDATGHVLWVVEQVRS